MRDLLTHLLILPLKLTPNRSLHILIMFRIHRLTLFRLTVRHRPLHARLNHRYVRLNASQLPRRKSIRLHRRNNFLIRQGRLIKRVPILRTIIGMRLTHLRTFPSLAMGPRFMAVNVRTYQHTFNVRRRRMQARTFQRHYHQAFIR